MVILGFECIKGIPRPCPENTFNPVQNGSCQPCPPGGVTFEEGSVECVIVKVNLPSKPAETVLSYFFVNRKQIRSRMAANRKWNLK